MRYVWADDPHQRGAARVWSGGGAETHIPPQWLTQHAYYETNVRHSETGTEPTKEKDGNHGM